MDWEYLDSIRGVATTLRRSGKSIADCAYICGCSEEDIKKLFKRYGTGKFSRGKESRPIAVQLLKQGYTVKEIAEKLDLSESWVIKVACENGISPATEVKRERNKLIEIVRRYKAKGLTYKEVANALGVSVHFVRDYCVGISPQRTEERSLSDREAKAIKLIERYGYQYVGGFSSTDGFVTIRCPKCGAVFERSMVSIRHSDTQSITCPGCAEMAREEKRRTKEQERLRKEEERQKKTEERKREAEAKENAKWHKCPVCGTLTKRPKYCSDECSKKALNTTHEARRRKKIGCVTVDKDITLQKLYERDHGVCYLCGEVCDWDDKEERDGVVFLRKQISFDRPCYPSGERGRA